MKFVWLFLLILVQNTYAEDCGQLSQRLATISRNSSSRARINDADQREYETLIRAAVDLRQTFFSGRWQPTSLSGLRTCTTDDQFMTIENEFQAEMWKYSLIRLGALGGGYAQLASILTANDTQVFQIQGHIPGESDQDTAGFHRGDKSIMMNLSRIHPDDWMIYFTHETLHAIDLKLLESVVNFGSPQVRTAIGAIENDVHSNKVLTPSQRTTLKTWIAAGLDRGLVAEWRAWTVTFGIYLSSKRRMAFRDIPWIEKILEDRRPGESLGHFAFRFLDPNFLNPHGKIWSTPVVRGIVNELRSGIRSNPRQLGFDKRLDSIIAAEGIQVW